MKIIDKKLYLTISECVECGIASDGYIRKAKSEGTKCWDIIDDPADKRKVLVGYEDLNDERRRKVEVRFGNPYDLVARQPIKDMVVADWKAHEYFMGYRYTTSPSGYSSLKEGGEFSLPVERVNQYTRAASWLNMLGAVDKSKVKKELNLLLTEFYMHVSELLCLEKERGKLKGYAGVDVLPGDFPSSYQRLMAKVNSFAELRKAQGDQAAWDSLIDPLYGNKNASKIGKVAELTTSPFGYSSLKEGGESPTLRGDTGGDSAPVREIASAKGLAMTTIGAKSAEKKGGYCPDLAEKQMALIRAVLAKANNLDAGQVEELVNSLFEVNGWKTLSRQTYHRIMSENMHVLTPGRQGKRKYMSSVAMQNKRKGPEYPLLFWTLDGWTVEMMYQERTTKGIEYKRLVMVVVMDPYNKYPVGYAIGERETADLIRVACRNAVIHMGQLFGAPYRALQVQSDNYQIKNLTPFYQALAGLYFTPAAVGNSKAKPIEPYFKHLNKKHAQKTRFWTGFNVDAKKSNQVNREYLDKIKTHAPDKAGLIKQIELMMDRERAAKVEDFKTGFAALPEADKRVMDGADYLQVFGVPLGKTNKITGQGIIKEISGVEYVFDSFDPDFRANMHLDWQLVGDMDNLTRVLAVSPDGKKRFVLEEKRILPMDLYSTTQADVDYRMKVKHFNEERMTEITELYASDARIAAQVVENTPLNLENENELALKLMLTYGGQQKEGLQNAKRLGSRGSTALTMTNNDNEMLELLREARMNDMVDFGKYLNPNE